MVRWPDKAHRGSHLASGPIKLCHPATITEPEIKAFEVGRHALLLGYVLYLFTSCFQAWLELGIPRAPKPVGFLLKRNSCHHS